MKPKGKMSRATLRTKGKEGYHIRETRNMGRQG
jgi:hypothetical protein